MANKKNDQVEKKKLIVDGRTLEDLVILNEAEIRKTVVQVPGQDRIVPVSSGVRIIPAISATVKVTRGGDVIGFLRDWFEKGETKDCVVIRTDGAGNEIGRELWPNTELSQNNPGGFDANNVDFARQNVEFLPEDIISIDPE